MSSYEAAIEAVQVERMFDHYLDSPELRGTSDGKVYTPQAMHEMIADYMGRLVRIEWTWDSITVTPLAADPALAVAPWHRADFGKDGTVSRLWGLTTVVWVRRDGRWRMLYGQGDHYPDTVSVK